MNEGLCLSVVRSAGLTFQMATVRRQLLARKAYSMADIFFLFIFKKNLSRNRPIPTFTLTADAYDVNHVIRL